MLILWGKKKGFSKNKAKFNIDEFDENKISLVKI